LLFIVETLRPASAPPEQVAGRLQGDQTRLETILDDPRLFLSEQSNMAEKVLTFLMNRYLQFTRYTLFEW
jgi:hypothetical protein